MALGERGEICSRVQGSAKCSVFILYLVELSQHYSTLKMAILVKNYVKVWLSSYQVSVLANLILRNICSEKWELIFYIIDAFQSLILKAVSDNCQFKTAFSKKTIMISISALLKGYKDTQINTFTLPL